MAANLELLFTGMHADKKMGGIAVFPNPFTESTEISFFLPEKTTVAMHLFDVTGVEVKHVVESEFTAGHHQVTLNRSDLESGYYLLRATIGNGDQIREEIRKIIIH